MSTTATINIPRAEYSRLKEAEAKLRYMLAARKHAAAIKKARKEMAEGKIIPAEEVFRKLGL